MMFRSLSSLVLIGAAFSFVSCSAPLAPETLPQDKVICYHYAAGTCLSKDGETGPWRKDTHVPAFKTVRYTAELNSDRERADMVGGGQYLSYETDAKGKTQIVSYDYKRTGRDTAQIEYPGYEWCTTYTLKFDTPVSGTASYEYTEADWEDKGTNIPFTIK